MDKALGLPRQKVDRHQIKMKKVDRLGNPGRSEPASLELGCVSAGPWPHVGPMPCPRPKEWEPPNVEGSEQVPKAFFNQSAEHFLIPSCCVVAS